MGFTKHIEVTYNGVPLAAFPLFEDNTFKISFDMYIPNGSIIKLFENKEE